ncbi:MAG TPA: hypothetical protein VG125_32465 [Pirellulales bacterium]|jgi:hypothetical protein|nr:hypothetical protein [Pirellulales bacterium]
MTETIQAIRWALERPCSLRQGGNWQTVHETHRQLKRVVRYADAVADNCVVDDICVTAHGSCHEGPTGKATLPLAGFSIHNAFGQFGGVDRVREACSGCEANVGGCCRRLWGGCHGSFDVWPHSPDLERALRSKAARSKPDLTQCFPPTTPMWFGFWMTSPLSPEQYNSLQNLLNVRPLETHDDNEDLAHFLMALDAAIRWQLPLHVDMEPPVMAVLDGVVVLAHCPRCKAEARPGRCRRAPLEHKYRCEVCGHYFTPRERKRLDVERSVQEDRLETALGPDHWDSFAREFLRRRGYPPSALDDLLDEERRERSVRWIEELTPQHVSPSVVACRAREHERR